MAEAEGLDTWCRSAPVIRAQECDLGSTNQTLWTHFTSELGNVRWRNRAFEKPMLAEGSSGEVTISVSGAAVPWRESRNVFFLPFGNNVSTYNSIQSPGSRSSSAAGFGYGVRGCCSSYCFSISQSAALAHSSLSYLIFFKINLINQSQFLLLTIKNPWTVSRPARQVRSQQYDCAERFWRTHGISVHSEKILGLYFRILALPIYQ